MGDETGAGARGLRGKDKAGEAHRVRLLAAFESTGNVAFDAKSTRGDAVGA